VTQRLSDLSGYAAGRANFPSSVSEIPQYLANLDPMTVGLILLAACAAYLVWAGGTDERARSRARPRSGRGVTLPPPMVPDRYFDQHQEK